MANKKITLKDSTETDNLYPATFTSQVFNEDGVNVDTLITDLSNDVDTALNSLFNRKTIWTNPNPNTAVGAGNYYADFNGTAKLIVVEFRLYVGGEYLTSETFAYTGTNSLARVVSGYRWDGSTNYIVLRYASYNFATNMLNISGGYRQDTYKTSVADNSALVPTKIVAYY